jgi:glycosyltransferase involved in cell wall biosynthesis/GT2 family glycosyltransferase
MTGDKTFKRSWGEGAALLNLEHTRIFDETNELQGWQHIGDTQKLYEMAFYNGGVILEIGTYSGRSAAVEIRGALAGLAQTAQGRLPQYYGIDISPHAIPRTYNTLTSVGLAQHALLFLGTLAQFRREIPIVPTMVFVDGGHDYRDVWADLHQLSEMLAPGTPVLCHEFVGIDGVERAVNEWAQSEFFEPMGQFGCSALLRATTKCKGEAAGLPLDIFDHVRQALLKEYLTPSGDANLSVKADRVGAATAPARAAMLAHRTISGDFGKRGWPYEKPEGPSIPDCLPDGSPWPKISIVTPSYNYGRYLEETILSVVNQGYPHVEHLLIDGGSTDETAVVIEKYRETFAYAVSEPDKGQSDAINKGFARATGELLTWINADDLLAPGALLGMAMAFWHSKADMVAGICEQYRDGRLLEKHMTCCDNGPLPLAELLDVEESWVKGQFFMQPEVMFTRAIWEKAGGHVREDLFYSMDYELWLRFALAGATLHVIGRSICHFRHHSEQKTALPEKFMPELRQVSETFAVEHGVLPAKRLAPASPRHSLRIASVTDVGFQHGAGIGQRRILTALAAGGHNVYSFAATEDGASKYAANVEEIVEAVSAVSPDLVLIGNVHAARLSSDLAAACARQWPTGVILHDLWSLTGRCAYTGGCTQYQTGCDDKCPTPEEYPPLPLEQIRPQWEAKYALYESDHAPLLLGNSEWTTRFAREALAAQGNVSRKSQVLTIRFGVELDIFRPLPKQFCRQELDLPQDRFLILTSASALKDERKGVRLLAEAVRQLSLPDVVVVCLGQPDDQLQSLLPGIRSLGYVRDARRLAMAYAAADLFVGASREEAFGQVFTEASACGTPSVGFAVGGIPESIADGTSGRLVTHRTTEDLASVIYELYRQPQQRRSMAAWGRLFAENEWSPEAAYHHLHLALRKSGLSERLQLPPKIRFVPNPPKVPTPVNLGLRHGTWRPIFGFDEWEGPYPDKGLPRCRWMVGPISRIRITGRHAGKYRLRIKCSTFHPNAIMRVVYNDQLVKDVAVPAFVRDQPTCEFECEIDFDGIREIVEFIHWPWAIASADRGVSILLFEIDIVDSAHENLVHAEPARTHDFPSHRS